MYLRNQQECMCSRCAEENIWAAERKVAAKSRRATGVEHTQARVHKKYIWEFGGKNLNGNYQSEDLGGNLRMVFQWIVKKWDVRLRSETIMKTVINHRVL
jgi:hypothetical protein